MDKMQLELTKVIEKYFGADAGYLDISCLDLARTIIDAGWTKPVRCEDCKHYDPSQTNIYGHHACKFHTSGAHGYNSLWVGGDDFCSAWEGRNNG